jgi:hypothetical protein
MWIYTQAAGEIRRHTIDSPVIGIGYAGAGDGKNSTEHERIKNVGPLPRGLYQIGLPHDHPRLGRYVLSLFPDKNNRMYGRKGFAIHGDSIATPGKASEGCIIMPYSVRVIIHESRDGWLVVI